MVAPVEPHTKKIWLTTAIVVVVLAALGVILFFVLRARSDTTATTNTAVVTQTQTPTATPVVPPATSKATETVVSNLEIPWELVFVLDNHMLVTERAGTLLHISDKKTALPIAGVEHLGESGLLGLELHPDFATNHQLYLYLTTRTGDKITNRVDRYEFDGVSLSNKKTIIENIPGEANHDGGRIKFGPDGKLYIATGDGQDQFQAQNTKVLHGKILRVNEDGSIPSDNPFGNAVWSIGHRNVQGLAWDDQGRLWATEHGPSADCPLCGQDELNLIEKGKNYGWPTIVGDQKQDGLVSPILHSGADKDTWAPSGMVFYKKPGAKQGSFFFAGLRGETLYEAKLTGDRSVKLVEHFKGQFGRLRTVVIGPDGFFYLLTNNTDGRGTPKEGDDKIIKIDPTQL
ncbi:MAG: PQQ-dependent sugar dehydrogenase [Candidatus Andersenbacteria bacterium]